MGVIRGTQFGDFCRSARTADTQEARPHSPESRHAFPFLTFVFEALEILGEQVLVDTHTGGAAAALGRLHWAPSG